METWRSNAAQHREMPKSPWGKLKRAISAVVAGASLLGAPAAGSAQSMWFDLTVPGSLEEMLGTADRSLEGPHLLRSLIGVFHDPTGTIVNPAQAAGAFRDCLGDVQRLRDRWRAVERAAGEVSLPAASASDDGRRALQEFIDRLDLRLVSVDGTLRAAPNRAEGRGRGAGEAEEPSVCGVGGGWAPTRIARRLNAGEAIAWDVPRFDVSLPLSPRVWLQVLYGDDPGDGPGAAERAAERAADLVGRLVTDSRAARLYAGLAALDDSTLAWLLAHPQTLSRLAGDHLAAFSRFGGGLRVRDGAVQAPGGAAFWEALVGVPVSDPERFVDRLFDSEPAATAFDLISRLPDSSRRFMIGAGQSDSRARRRSLTQLGRVIEALPPPAARFADREIEQARGFRFTPRPGLRMGDRLNENICDLPDDEAIALTWQLVEVSDQADPERFFACGPLQCTFQGQPNESAALDMVLSHRRGGEIRFVCEVEATMGFPHSLPRTALGQIQRGGFGGIPTSPARVYRLGYPLTGQDQDPRQFIVR